MLKPIQPLRALLLLLAWSIAGCESSPHANVQSVPYPGSYDALAGSVKRIKHIVIVIQENRSFDNVFFGFPGADSAPAGRLHDGSAAALRGTGFRTSDVSHDWATAIADWDGGKMDGFDLGWLGPGQRAGSYPYAHLERHVVEPYWEMASRYVLADRMFPTMFGESFTAHLNLIAGTSSLTPGISEVDAPSAPPWGCDAPAGTKTALLTKQRNVTRSGPFPCFTQFRTMAERLDDARVSWRYYASAIGTRAGQVWSGFDAIAYVRHGPDWRRNVVSPPSTVLSDIERQQLADVSWVTPDLLDSDHAGVDSTTGPSWVASVVNAIGESPYWDSTAIVVVWDDWGGWYDHVPPQQRDFRGLGIRVPCIIISPFAKRHYVSHTQYEFASILKFVEQVYGLAPLGPESLGYTDTRANSLLDSFDFRNAAEKYRPIAAPFSARYFARRRPSLLAPDT